MRITRLTELILPWLEDLHLMYLFHTSRIQVWGHIFAQSYSKLVVEVLGSSVSSFSWISRTRSQPIFVRTNSEISIKINTRSIFFYLLFKKFIQLACWNCIGIFVYLFTVQAYSNCSGVIPMSSIKQPSNKSTRFLYSWYIFWYSSFSSTSASNTVKKQNKKKSI